ncbi:MAG: hypothetical protein ABIB98_00095 [bacterium]
MVRTIALVDGSGTIVPGSYKDSWPTWDYVPPQGQRLFFSDTVTFFLYEGLDFEMVHGTASAEVQKLKKSGGFQVTIIGETVNDVRTLKALVYQQLRT